MTPLLFVLSRGPSDLIHRKQLLMYPSLKQHIVTLKTPPIIYMNMSEVTLLSAISGFQEC